MSKAVLVWHRRDLWLDDNSLYYVGESDNTDVVFFPVYVFDTREFARRKSIANPEWDIILTGPHAAANLISAVGALRNSLRELNGELIVRAGNPSTVILSLPRHLGLMK